MPLYEFVCDECETGFELLVGFSQADQPQTCPTCGGLHTHRKVSTFAMGGGAVRNTAGPVTRPASSPFT